MLPRAPETAGTAADTAATAAATAPAAATVATADTGWLRQNAGLEDELQRNQRQLL